MFDNLGIQWAGTLLGCLAVIMVPIPVCFYLFGAKLREKSKFAPTMKSKPAPADDSSEGEEEDGQFVALHASRSHAFDQTLPTTNGNGASVPGESEKKAE